MVKRCDTDPFGCPCSRCQAFTVRRQVRHASNARRDLAKLLKEAPRV